MRPTSIHAPGRRTLRVESAESRPQSSMLERPQRQKVVVAPLSSPLSPWTGRSSPAIEGQASRTARIGVAAVAPRDSPLSVRRRYLRAAFPLLVSLCPSQLKCNAPRGAVQIADEGAVRCGARAPHLQGLARATSYPAPRPERVVNKRYHRDARRSRVLCRNARWTPLNAASAIHS